MLSSGDSLLLSILAILVPAVGILVGTVLYAASILRRYSNALQRLYSASFKGADSERKRIASEWHDHLGAHSILMSDGFERIKQKDYKDSKAEIKTLEKAFSRFRYETHVSIAYMYPKGLVDPDWLKSFELLSQQLSMNDVVVEFEMIGEKTPSNEYLHNTYWAVHEIIVNAIKHSKAKHIQISITSQLSDFTINIQYMATPNTRQWIKVSHRTKSGFGTSIIQDRLKMVNAKDKIRTQKGFVSHTITFQNETPTP
jgi:signal transduction histidine kinase